MSNITLNKDEDVKTFLHTKHDISQFPAITQFFFTKT